MAITAEKGYCKALMTTLQQLTQLNYPGHKITPVGFLKAIIENDPSIGIPEYERLRLNSGIGDRKKVRVVYQPRVSVAQIGTEFNCDNDAIPAKKESEIDASIYAKHTFTIPDLILEQYCAEGLRPYGNGLPPQVLVEHAEYIKTAANAIFQSLNSQALAQLVFGTNAATGSNAVKTININQNTDVLKLDAGFIELMNDYQFNEGAGVPIIVGEGLMGRYELAKRRMLGPQSNGLNIAAFDDYKFYYDLKASGVFAGNTALHNDIAVFQPGTIGWVDFQKYVGFKTGQRGSFYYTQIMLPMGDTPNAPLVSFDLAMQYIGCPTEIGDGYGGLTNVDSGWSVTISKSGGLWQMPSDAYNSDDRLTGLNGALHYRLTNDCENCEAV